MRGMATCMWSTVRGACLSRPPASETETETETAGAPEEKRKESTREPPSLQAMQPNAKRQLVEVPRPKVCLDKVQGRCSNAAVATSRYHHRCLTEDYEVSPAQVLGEGCSGKVVMARHIASGRKCALKRIDKRTVSAKILQQLIAEVEIFLTLDHPNVTRLNDVYDTDKEIALLTECLDGGELYARLAELKTFPEPLAAETTRQMLRAVGYLHSHDIVHRDLKLENFLYESSAEDAPLKVIDFGFAKVWDSSKLMQASCGSVAYVSPDVLRGVGYTSKCDLWSLGVIVFMLLSGYPPFHGSDEDMRAKILTCSVDWRHTKRWSKVSQHAMDFVKSLLVRDPMKRLDAQAAMNHRWLSGSAGALKPVLSAAAVRSIDSYAGAPSLRRAVLQLLARELAPDEVSEMRSTFLDMAGNQEGTVRLSELKAAIRGEEETQPGDTEAKTPARRLRRAKTEKLAELFQVMDVNGDEQVYYSDFIAATMDEKFKLSEAHLRAAFHRLDADNSGAISAEDIRNTIGETFEGVETEALVRDAGLSPSAHGEIGFDSFVRVLQDRNGREQLVKLEK